MSGENLTQVIPRSWARVRVDRDVKVKDLLGGGVGRDFFSLSSFSIGEYDLERDLERELECERERDREEEGEGDCEALRS